MAAYALKILLFALLALGAQILLTLDYSWRPPSEGGGSLAGLAGAFSVKLPSADTYRPDSQILAFQGLMKTHPRLGFTFRENLGKEGPLNLKWADQDVGTVTTDASGFVNSPYAIAARREGKRIRILGVGSSFMQGAAAKFHDFFWAKGVFYYSMATPRHTLPQFTAAVREYAVRERPEWILYDLNETSFELMQDYENWSKSGIDWFTYHSGTWCGPPRRVAPFFFRDHPGLDALYRGVRRKIAPPAPLPKASPEDNARMALGHILSARDAAREKGIRLLVVAIPSKDAAVYGRSEGWKNVEALLPMLRESGVEVLDLKPLFADEEDPRTLYYKVDAHWNDYGIFKAGLAITQYLSRAGHP